MNKLFLYSTSGCHLCEIAMALLADTLNAERYAVEEVEISDSDVLMERYSLRIPVLADPETGKELGWPFDQHQLIGFVQQLDANP